MFDSCFVVDYSVVGFAAVVLVLSAVGVFLFFGVVDGFLCFVVDVCFLMSCVGFCIYFFGWWVYFVDSAFV